MFFLSIQKIECDSHILSAVFKKFVKCQINFGQEENVENQVLYSSYDDVINFFNYFIYLINLVF